MSTSVKISELNEILAITGDDFFPLVDSGSGTTYRASFNTLNDWLLAYGHVSHSLSTDSASWAATSSFTPTSSWAYFAITASNALTASYFDTSAIIPIHSVSSSLANTASCLHGYGRSWENNFDISGTLTLSASAGIALPRKKNILGELVTVNSIFFNTEFGKVGATVNDWANIYYSENVADNGRLVCSLGDNIDAMVPDMQFSPHMEDFYQTPGFAWQMFNTDGFIGTGSLMFLKSDGTLYLRSAVARSFTASIAGEGFHGTASWAQNLVGLTNAIVPPIGTIVDYAGTVAPADDHWHLCDGTSLPTATSASLFAIIGYTYGGSGANFKLPDLRKQLTMGASGVQTQISGNVGQKGGGENMFWHHHAYGTSLHGAFDGSGATPNDDICFVWHGPRYLNFVRDFPNYKNGMANYSGLLFLVTGDSNPGVQPFASFYGIPGIQGTGVSGADFWGFPLGTSYPLVDTGGTDLNHPTLTADQMPPYTVVNKIIRVF